MTQLIYRGVKAAFAVAKVSYSLRWIITIWFVIWAYLLHPSLGALTATILCPTRGKEIIVDRIMGAGAQPLYIHWGTGGSAVVAGSTGLSTPSADEARTLGTASKQTTTVTNDTYRLVGTVTCAVGGKTITNMGIFDDLTAGNLFVMVDSLSQALSVGDGISSTWNNKFVSA